VIGLKVGDIVEVTEDCFSYKKGDKGKVIKVIGRNRYRFDKFGDWENPLVRVVRYSKTRLWKKLNG